MSPNPLHAATSNIDSHSEEEASISTISSFAQRRGFHQNVEEKYDDCSDGSFQGASFVPNPHSKRKNAKQNSAGGSDSTPGKNHHFNIPLRQLQDKPSFHLFQRKRKPPMYKPIQPPQISNYHSGNDNSPLAKYFKKLLRILAIFVVTFVLSVIGLQSMKEMYLGKDSAASIAQAENSVDDGTMLHSPQHDTDSMTESLYFSIWSPSNAEELAHTSTGKVHHPLTSSQPNPDTMNSTEYYHYCHNLDHISIFRLGSRINCRDNSETLSVAFVICILFTLSIELLLHFLEHKFKHDMLKMTLLNKVYKELMMLSIISSLISALESLDMFEIIFEVVDKIEEWIHELFHIKISENKEDQEERIERRVKLFEFVHVSLFFLSCWYVSIVSCCYRIIRRKWKRWKLYEKHWTAETSLLRYNSIKQEMKDKKWTLLFRWVLLYQYWDAVLRKHYFTIRKRFIILNELKCSYRFDSYLKMCTMKIFADLIEISLLLWTIVWVGFLLNYTRNKILDMRTSYGGVPMFVGVFGYGSVLVAALIYVSLRIGFTRYLRNNSLDSYLLGPYLEEYQKSLLNNQREESSVNNDKSLSTKRAHGSSSHVDTYGSIQGTKDHVNSAPTQSQNDASSVNTPAYQSSDPSATAAPYQRNSDEDEEIYFDSEMDYQPPSCNREQLEIRKCKSMRNYFILWSSNFSLYTIQFVLLIQAFYISLIVMHFGFVIFKEPYFPNFVTRLLFFVISLLPTVLFVFLLFPLIVPLFVVLSSVDDHLRKDCLFASQEKFFHEKERIRDRILSKAGRLAAKLSACGALRR